MPHLDYTAFVNSRRDERSLGHHTLRTYAQDLRTFARFSKAHELTDPLSKDDILAYHRHLRDDLGAKPATIERRVVTLKSYYAWREDRNSALPSPFADVRISVRIPRSLPRPIERDTLRAVFQAGDGPIAVRSNSAGHPAFGLPPASVKIVQSNYLQIHELAHRPYFCVPADLVSNWSTKAVGVF